MAAGRPCASLPQSQAPSHVAFFRCPSCVSPVRTFVVDLGPSWAIQDDLIVRIFTSYTCGDFITKVPLPRSQSTDLGRPPFTQCPALLGGQLKALAWWTERRPWQGQVFPRDTYVCVPTCSQSPPLPAVPSLALSPVDTSHESLRWDWRKHKNCVCPCRDRAQFVVFFVP